MRANIESPPVAKVTASRPALVIGGGIAGVTAAWDLRRRGVPVRLIEATPHLGGRIESVRQDTGVLETGTGLPIGYKWRVQTGSFLDEGRARQLARALEQEGFHPVRITEYREGERLYFRVLVGDFSTRAQADKLANRFRRDGRSAIVVRGRQEL